MTDIDGTLIQTNKGLLDQVKRAAQYFIAAGGGIGFCTGRSRFSVNGLAQELGVNVPSILYTGSAIYDFQKEECIAQTAFGPEILSLLTDTLREYPSFSIQIYTMQGVYLLRKTSLLAERGIREEVPEDVVNMDFLKPMRREILKIAVTCWNRELLEEYGQKYFQTELGNFAFASTHFAEIVPKASGKGSAVKKLSEILQVPLSFFFGAGDGDTDMPFLRETSFAFVPSTAKKQVRDLAHMISPPAETGGMALAFYQAAEMMKRWEEE